MGRLSPVKPVQPEKAEVPILLTESEILMLVKLLVSEKAQLPILVTPVPIVTSVDFFCELL